MCRIFETLIAYGFAHILKRRRRLQVNIDRVRNDFFLSRVLIGPFYLSIYFCDLLWNSSLYSIILVKHVSRFDISARICYHCILCLDISLFSVIKYSLLLKIIHIYLYIYIDTSAQ